jgi:hypothetical protein
MQGLPNPVCMGDLSPHSASNRYLDEHLIVSTNDLGRLIRWPLGSYSLPGDEGKERMKATSACRSAAFMLVSGIPPRCMRIV